MFFMNEFSVIDTFPVGAQRRQWMASSLLSMVPLARHHLIPVAPKKCPRKPSSRSILFLIFIEPLNSKRGSNSRQVFVEKKNSSLLRDAILRSSLNLCCCHIGGLFMSVLSVVDRKTSQTLLTVCTSWRTAMSVCCNNTSMRSSLYAYGTNLNQTFPWYDSADKNSREFVLTGRIPSVNNRFKTSYLVL